MFLVLFSICLILIFVIKKTVRDRTSRVFGLIFCCFWFFSLILCTFRPYGFFEVQTYTYVLLIVAIVAFFTGYCSYRIKAVHNNKYLAGDEEFLVRRFRQFMESKIYLCIILFISIYELQFAINALILAEESTTYLTEDKQDFMFMGNKLGLLLWMYLMFPIFHIQCLNISVVLIKKIRPSILFIISSICFFAVFGILNGGRTLFVIFFLYLLFTQIIVGEAPKKGIQKLKKCLGAIAIVCVLFIGMMYMTAYRIHGSFEIKSEDFNEAAFQMAETPLKYSVLPVVLFDRSLKEDYIIKFGGYKYGRMTFCGVDIITSGFLKRLGIHINSTDEVMQYLQNQWKSCSPTKRYNYAYTGVFYHYMDFGVFGVILFPLFFGLIVRSAISRFYIVKTIPWFLYICFLFYLTIHSIFSNYLHSTWIIVYIPTLWIWDYLVRYKLRFSNLSQKNNH